MKYECPECGMVYGEPGSCTMDGAKLVVVKREALSNSHKHANHSDHHKLMMQDFKKRFIISSIITVPILVLSPLIQKFLGLNISFEGGEYVLFILSTFIFFYGGWPFLKGFFTEVRAKRFGMMTLIGLAISVAYLYSSAVVFGFEGRFFFWELATLIDVMLLGHWIEMRSVLSASKALEKLAQLMPDKANVIRNGEVISVRTVELKKGDIVLVKAGEKVPADGVIVRGESYVDESMLTGESKPVLKKEGLKVIGGSVNGDGVLEVRVTGIGEDSYLNKVINLVKTAQQSKSKTQRLADKAANWLTIIAITVSVSTFAYWVSKGYELAFAVERMATVMVIACPHALGLAIPLVSAVSTALSARNGLLIRNRTAFENARKITSVVFDKTGTLTEGKFSVSKIKVVSGEYDERRIVRLAASLEQHSEHLIAGGIVNKAKELGVRVLKVVDFKVLKGVGVEGRVNNKVVKLVSENYLKKLNIKVPEFYDEGLTLVYVLVDDKIVGVISLDDKVRRESFQAIKELQKQGVKCWMLTGDNERVAKRVSERLGLNGYFAEVLPHQKLDKIKELQGRGEFVAMVGDGINDAPALAQADVGVAIGSGTDIAAETADIILVNSNPLDVTKLITFGRATYNKMVENLLWATGYNVFAIPLAAGVLYNAGVLLTPAVGAALMSLSTVIVALNAKFLRV